MSVSADHSTTLPSPELLVSFARRRRPAGIAAQSDPDPHRLVFIGETGASTELARLPGRIHAP